LSGAPTSGSRRLARIATLAAAIGPPAGAGFALGDAIERRLGTPRTIATALLAGAAAMGAAELSARRRGRSRLAREAGPRDGLALGVAQAVALAPGLSRSGLTTAAARARGFDPAEADRLSWRVGIPVIAGAALLKAVRQARAGIPPGQRAALGAGAVAALLSTLASARVLTSDVRVRLLFPTIAYRVVLAGVVAVRTRGRAAGTPNQSK
jgi:undecaprenyl-diphosphatase